MNIGFYNFYRFYNKNRMFLSEYSPIGDGLMYPYVYLAEYLKSKGHTVSTIDMAPLNEYDAVVFFDFPSKYDKYFRRLVRLKNSPPLFLVILEPQVVKPSNWDTHNHHYFKKIFTSNLKFVDQTRYFWLNPANKIEFDPKYFNLESKSKFCTLIASNKYSNQANELYSERLKTIHWFNQNHSDKFDLYGVDWDRVFIPFMGRLNFILSFIYRKCPWLPNFNKFTFYKGRIERKRDVLSNYRFAICYENARVSGYITEKIFDCFMAGVIPIYWGEPEVEKLIPSSAFIDRGKFKNHEDLFNFLSTMTDAEHQRYLDEIAKFLNSDDIAPWSTQFFAKTLERHVCKTDIIS